MSMSYQAFKDFVIVHLWKVADTVVIANLDNLILLAEAELNRTFKVEDRAKVVKLPMIDNVVVMPADLRTIRNVHVQGLGDFSYAAPADYYHQLDDAASNNCALHVYTTVGKQILLSIQASANVPLTLTLTYKANIPSFKATGASWLADTYFDVYLYCVLKHTGPFLREDERIAMWKDMFMDAIGSAMVENDDNMFAGSPVAIRFETHA